MRYLLCLFLLMFLFAGQLFAQKVRDELIGTWSFVKMVPEPYESGYGGIFRYILKADSTFEFMGYIASTKDSCTTYLLNDKRGKFTVDGNKITFAPTKNYWKSTSRCSPESNKEKDYILDEFTYTWQIKDLYGQKAVCLADTKGEACYYREKE